MTARAEYSDARLIQLYDLQNRWAADDEFFLGLAAERPTSRIADVGCGTGRLTTALAGAGHTVTGVDPALASLQVAQRKPHAVQVTWLCGTAADLPSAAFDLALMTSHVSQVFTDDADWHDTLRHLHRALAQGGRLAFDMRDPAARAWSAWDSGDERETVVLPDGERVETWTTVDVVSELAGLVSFTEHTHFLATGEQIHDPATLKFRTEAELRNSVEVAGFTVEHLFGGWQREDAGAGCGELVVVARKIAANRHSAGDKTSNSVYPSFLCPGVPKVHILRPSC